MPDNNQILDEPTSQKITLTGRKIIEASAGTGKTYTL
ncbi:MAG: ATP-dependent exoDNAse (exonuclease V) beta subunit, partial [Gammaproteobacteria bacterium]